MFLGRRKSKMKSGFDVVINRRGTNSLKWDSRADDILPLWVADMDFTSPRPVINAILQRAEQGVFGYSITPESCYDAIIAWMEKRHGWRVNRDWISFAPGVVPAINLLVRSLTYPGDKVILQPPVYYPFFDAVNNNGCHILENPLVFENGSYRMDFEDLEAKAKDPRAKLLVLCNPHNPVGRVWTKEELEQLGKICIKNNIIVISDELHSDLVYRPYFYTPFAMISDEFAQKSVICMGPSKTFNLAGLQASCIMIPDPAIKARYENFLSPKRLNIFGCVAMEAAYSYGEEWLDELLEYLKSNIEFLEQYIAKEMPKIGVIKPEGTYLVWLDCRDLGFSYSELEERMLKQAKVWLDEGYIFGQGGECFERINVACPRETLRQALERMKNALG